MAIGRVSEVGQRGSSSQRGSMSSRARSLSRPVGLVLAAAMLVVPAACSENRAIESDAPITKDTVRLLEDETLDNDPGLASGSEAAAQIQKLVDSLVEENDPCVILSPSTVSTFNFDPSVLASSQARKTLAQGYVQVLNHLVTLVNDPEVTPALVIERDSVVEILDIVEKYSASPTSREGTKQIEAVTNSPAYVEASEVVARWVVSHCG